MGKWLRIVVRRWVWLAALLVLNSVSGCSLLFMSRAPENHETLDYFQCNDSTTLPATDVSTAVTAGVWSGYSIYAREYVLTGVFGGLVVLEAISAGVGFSAVDECLRAKQDMIYRQEMRIERELRQGRSSSAVPPPAR